LAIEREWAKYPGWFLSLDNDTQSSLLAEFMTRNADKSKKRG